MTFPKNCAAGSKFCYDQGKGRAIESATRVQHAVCMRIPRENGARPSSADKNCEEVNYQGIAEALQHSLFLPSNGEPNEILETVIACVRRLLRTKRGSNKLVDTIRNDVRPEVRLQAVRTFILFALQSSACARLLVQTSSVPCLASLCFQGVAETSKARRESTNPLFRWPKAQVRCAATYALQAIVCAIKPHGKYPEEARIFRLHRGFDIVVWHAECGTKNDAYEKRKVDIAYNLRATRFSKMTLMHDIPTEELQRIDAGISGEMGKGGGGQTLIMSRGEAIFNHPF